MVARTPNQRALEDASEEGAGEGQSGAAAKTYDEAISLLEIWKRRRDGGWAR